MKRWIWIDCHGYFAGIYSSQRRMISDYREKREIEGKSLSFEEAEIEIISSAQPDFFGKIELSSKEISLLERYSWKKVRMDSLIPNWRKRSLYLFESYIKSKGGVR